LTAELLGVSDTYSLWLVPNRKSTAYRDLQATIAELATAHDTQEFDPHVTLLGGISGPVDRVLETTESLAEAHQALSLSLETIQCSTTRHQCVFALVEATLPLLSLRQTAAREFGLTREMYVPHLSLIYSDMPLGERFTVVDSLNRSSLPTAVLADELAVVETSGFASEWSQITSYQLSSE
jgi:2'-5' RNA ligase